MSRAFGLLLACLFTGFAGWAQEIPVATSFSLEPAGGSAFLPRDPSPQPSASVLSAWQMLERMPAEDRENATIYVTPGKAASFETRALAREIEVLWNGTEYHEAVKKLARLESIEAPGEIEIAVKWKTPRLMANARQLVGNVRIGTADSIRSVCLATDHTKTKLFAVVGQTGDGYRGSWHVFQSTDVGETWTETDYMFNIYVAPRMALASVQNSIYVGYIRGSGRYLRIRRVNTEDGGLDTLAGGVLYADAIITSPSDTLVGIAGASNASSYQSQAYFAVSTSSGHVNFLMSNVSADTLWTVFPDSSAEHVAGGLSLAYGLGDSTGNHAYISYIDSLHYLCVDTVGRTLGPARRSTRWANAYYHTSLSAWHDTVVCGYTYSNLTAQMRYIITYTAGANWLYGFPVDTTQTHESPVPALENGQGIGLFYRHYTATSREGRFIYRDYKRYSLWSEPVNLTDYSLHYWPSAIVALPGKLFCVAYIVDNYNPALGAVFFVKYQVPLTDVSEDQEIQPTSHQLFQNYPNPFNPRTEIGYGIGVASNTRLIVYDLLGREVKVLLDEPKEAGVHSVTWDASGMASGIYICRMQAGDFSAVRKLVLMK